MLDSTTRHVILDIVKTALLPTAPAFQIQQTSIMNGPAFENIDILPPKTQVRWEERGSGGNSLAKFTVPTIPIAYF